MGRGWSGGDPSVETIAVRKERSVCTVTSIATDDAAIACALGSSGKVELWDRRRSRRVSEAGRQARLSSIDGRGRALPAHQACNCKGELFRKKNS